MENNNLSPPQDGEPGDWRSTLQLDGRQRIVNNMVSDWKTHLPFSGEEGLLELWKISAMFEEKIYAVATSQSDYIWKIVMKIRTVEGKSQNIMANSLQSSSAGNSSSNPNQGKKISTETFCEDVDDGDQVSDHKGPLQPEKASCLSFT